MASDGVRYFVKTAGHPSDPAPYLGFEARVELLRTAARLAASVKHPLLPACHGTIESAEGPMLVMDPDSYRLGAYRNDMGTEPDPAARHPDYAAFHQAWRAARA